MAGFLGALVVCLILVGCGGGSSSTDSGSSSPAGESSDGQAKAEPSAQFLKPNGVNNKVVRFGHEASTKEREEVGAVVTENLKARAAAKFAAQCKTLNMKGIEEIPGAKNRGDCVKKLKEFAEPLSSTKRVRTNTLTGPIVALRVEGDQAFALYHGNDGKDYVLPLEKEGGAWKVSALLTTELTSPPEPPPTKESNPLGGAENGI